MRNIAIYARKSVESDKGESVKNQIDECKKHMNNANKENEELHFIEYIDEGYTGSNTHRPGFTNLMSDIKQGKLNVLICYRLDRVSRSVSDFSNTLDILVENKVDFVSVKEHFDTTIPMGRAMIQIASVFAQLERETIAERIRDNMYQLAKTDRWIGGKAPLGFKLKRIESENEGDKKRTKTVLELVEKDAELIKLMFGKYLELKSMTKLQTFLLQNHFKTQNGKDFTTNQIRIILTNPTYVMANEQIKDYYTNQGCDFNGTVDGECGLMTYCKTKSTITKEGKQGLVKLDKSKWIISVGTHKGIVSADDWLKVQLIIENNKGTFPNLGKSHTALLAGIIRCECCGSAMRVLHGQTYKDGRKGYYYVCKMRRNSKSQRCHNKNVRVDKVDMAIINDIRYKYLNKDKFLNELEAELKTTRQEKPLRTEETIRNDINKMNRKIDNSMERLSEDNAPTQLLYAKIKEFQLGIERLEEEMKNFASNKNEILKSEVKLDIMGELIDMGKYIDTMDFEERKTLINSLYETVFWNAEKDNLSIKHIDSKKKRDKLISMIKGEKDDFKQHDLKSSFSESYCQTMGKRF